MSEVIKGAAAIFLDGQLTDREAVRIQRLLERMGFGVERNLPGYLDEGLGSLMARRLDVIEQAGFINAVVELGDETRYYAGVAWGALKNAAGHRRLHEHWKRKDGSDTYSEFAAFPGRFLPVGFAEKPLFEAGTMLPSADWARANTAVYGITNRLADAWAAVACAYETQGMAINPEHENPYPNHLRHTS